MQFSLNGTMSKELSSLGINRLKSRELRKETDYAAPKSEFAKQLDLKRSASAPKDMKKNGTEAKASREFKNVSPETVKTEPHKDEDRTVKETTNSVKNEAKSPTSDQVETVKSEADEIRSEKMEVETDETKEEKIDETEELSALLQALAGLLEMNPEESQEEERLVALKETALKVETLIQESLLNPSSSLKTEEETGLNAEQAAKLLEELKAVLESKRSSEFEVQSQASSKKVDHDFSQLKELMIELAVYKTEQKNVVSSFEEETGEEAVSEAGEAETVTISPEEVGTQTGSNRNHQSDLNGEKRMVNTRMEGITPETLADKLNEIGNISLEEAEIAEVKENINVQQKIIPAMKMDVFEQVKSYILREGAGVDERSEMVIRLKPEELGRLELKIELHNDEVTAKFQVASQQVKEVLEANLEDLKMALKDKGFEVSQMAIDVRDGSKEGRAGSGRGNAQRSGSYYKIETQQEEMSLVYQKSLEATVAESTFEHLA